MHIPKTAGTSFRRMLDDVYDDESKLYLYDTTGLPGAVSPAAFMRVPMERRSRLQLVYGHFLYGIHRHVPGPSSYVAVLRDPVDRLLSLYHHVKLRGIGELHDMINEGMSFEEYVFSGKSLETDNQMVRQIGGPPIMPFGECSDSVLEDAISNVERRFGAIIFYEDMKPGINRLAGHTGRQFATLPRENTTPSRPLVDEVDPGVRKRILDFNGLDARLYAWAQSWMESGEP
jgi:hypothetical protein